jgi:hypothetical protein
MRKSTMNTKILATALIAAAGLVAAPAFARDVNADGEVGYIFPVPSVASSTLTREAVQAEYLQAKRNHQLPQVGEGADTAARPFQSQLSREAVQAEAIRALRAGEIRAGEV